MSEKQQIDRNQIQWIARQIAKIKGDEARKAEAKKVAEKEGGINRVAFYSALKDEIDRLWIKDRS